MNFAALADLATQLGAFGVAVIVVWALMTERLVPRARLDEMRRERDELQTQLDLERARNEPHG